MKTIISWSFPIIYHTAKSITDVVVRKKGRTVELAYDPLIRYAEYWGRQLSLFLSKSDIKSISNSHLIEHAITAEQLRRDTRYPNYEQ